jgi:hypothetical protein
MAVDRLADAEGAAAATRAVSETYGAFQIFSALNLAILVGWLVLALGAWRTQVLGPVRVLSLALMAGLPLGVLKGTTPLSLVALPGLTAASVLDLTREPYAAAGLAAYLVGLAEPTR